jgi:hypothetical protein
MGRQAEPKHKNKIFFLASGLLGLPWILTSKSQGFGFNPG